MSRALSVARMAALTRLDRLAAKVAGRAYETDAEIRTRVEADLAETAIRSARLFERVFADSYCQRDDDDPLRAADEYAFGVCREIRESYEAKGAAS